MGMISEKYCSPCVPPKKLAYRKGKVRKDYATDEDWRVRALCRNTTDPDTWYPLNVKDAKRGKEICEKCPVRKECGAYALANKELVGTWGGMTEWDRQKIFRFRSYKSS
jgi:WhiB family redox-sensing transcriptional regulator